MSIDFICMITVLTLSIWASLGLSSWISLNEAVIFITPSCSERNSCSLVLAYPKCSVGYDVFSGAGAPQAAHIMDGL